MSEETRKKDMAWRQSTDAMVWAEKFVETKKACGWSVEKIDENLMVAWFANYWAAVHDPLKREIESLQSQLSTCEETKTTLTKQVMEQQLELQSEEDDT